MSNGKKHKNSEGGALESSQPENINIGTYLLVVP